MTAIGSYFTEDDRALICGFRFRPGEPAERVEWGDIAKREAGLHTLWLHFDLVDVRACDWIDTCPFLPERARDVLLSTDEYPRFERIGQGIGGVIGDFDHDLHAGDDAMGVFQVYVERDLLITARRHPLKGTDRLRRDILGGERIDTPVDAFARLLLYVAYSFDTITAELDRLIDRFEDRLLGGYFRDEGRELGRARRTLAQLRRHAGSQRSMDYRAIVPYGCSDDQIYQLQRSAEALHGVLQDIEGLQVRARLVQDEMASRIGEETNRNLYFLSIVAAVFLPISIIAGIFGMNVGGIPWAASPGGFVFVLLIIAVTVFLTLLLLKWRKLI